MTYVLDMLLFAFPERSLSRPVLFLTFEQSGFILGLQTGQSGGGTLNPDSRLTGAPVSLRFEELAAFGVLEEEAFLFTTTWMIKSDPRVWSERSLNLRVCWLF